MAVLTLLTGHGYTDGSLPRGIIIYDQSQLGEKFYEAIPYRSLEEFEVTFSIVDIKGGKRVLNKRGVKARTVFDFGRSDADALKKIDDHLDLTLKYAKAYPKSSAVLDSVAATLRSNRELLSKRLRIAADHGVKGGITDQTQIVGSRFGTALISRDFGSYVEERNFKEIPHDFLWKNRRRFDLAHVGIEVLDGDDPYTTLLLRLAKAGNEIKAEDGNIIDLLKLERWDESYADFSSEGGIKGLAIRDMPPEIQEALKYSREKDNEKRAQMYADQTRMISEARERRIKELMDSNANSNKTCSRCQRKVPNSSRAGGVCPYPDCRVTWSQEFSF